MSNPHGTLRSLGGSRSPATADLSTGQLVEELLGRLHAGESVDDETSTVLAMALDCATEFAPSNRFSIAFLRNLIDSYRRSSIGFLPIEGQTFVELGVGSINPLACGMAHVLLGAERSIGFDLDPPQRTDAAVRGIARVMVWMLLDPEAFSRNSSITTTRDQVLRRLAPFDPIKLYCGDPTAIDDSVLSLRRRSATDLDLADGEADFVASNSFLEHVAEVPAVLEEIARVTRPGGYSVHGVDFRDHRIHSESGIHPLEFLCEAEGEAMVRGTNRMRRGALQGLFEQHGFELVEECVNEAIEVPGELRDRLAQPFRSMTDDDLRCLDAKFLLRRR